jgi:hypothetical protein
MASALENIKKKWEPYIRESKEFYERELPRADANASEGIKATLAINGGGAVAILGFMQALVTKSPVFAAFKYYGANALLFFALGILAGALVPAIRFVYIHKFIESTDEKDYPAGWERAYKIMWALSLIFFVVGVSCAGVGIDHALN